MKKRLSSMLFVAACLCLSAFAHAEVLNVESPMYVESVDVISLDVSEVEFKNSIAFEPVELTLNANIQENTIHRMQSSFSVANDSVNGLSQTLEVGWQFSI